MENLIKDLVNREIELMQISMAWYVRSKDGQKIFALFAWLYLKMQLYKNGKPKAEISKGGWFTLEQLCWIFVSVCQPCQSFGKSCVTAAEPLWLMARHIKLNRHLFQITLVVRQ